MKKVERGDVAYDFDELPAEDRWKATEEGCLQQFVEVVAKNRNEHVDTYMLKYEAAILGHLRGLGVPMAAICSRDQPGEESSDAAGGSVAASSMRVRVLKGIRRLQGSGRKVRA
jgi:hypothetical protein